MSVPPELALLCRTAATRLTLLRALRYGARGSAMVLLAALGGVFASAIVPLTLPALWVLAVALGAGVLVVVSTGLLQPVGMLAASRLLDQRLHLQERSSTALELALASAPPSALGARVIADAVAHMHGIDLRTVFPLRLSRDAWVAAGVAVVFVLASIGLRGVTLPGTPAGRTAQVIREEGNRLAQLAQTFQARARAERTPQTRRLSALLHDLGLQLQQQRMGRADALARVEAVSRAAEQAHREIDQRAASTQPVPQRDAANPGLRRQTLERQIKQLQELNARLGQNLSATDRQNALEQLAALAAGGDEGQVSQVRRQLDQAREQLRQGNVARANEAVSEAMRTLEGMQSLVADEEGTRAVEQQLQRSSAAIASGAAQAPPPDAAQVPPPSGRTPAAPGTNPPSPDSSPEASPPPRGPNEGTTAGSGQVSDKLGAPTERLQPSKSSQRLRGVQGEGNVTAAEVLGSARPGISRAPVAAAPPTLITQADRYMERAGIPARYRLLVRKYFERLVQLR